MDLNNLYSDARPDELAELGQLTASTQVAGKVSGMLGNIAALTQAVNKAKQAGATPAQIAKLKKAPPKAIARVAKSTIPQIRALLRITPAQAARLAKATRAQLAKLKTATPKQVALLKMSTPAQRAALAKATRAQLAKLKTAAPAQLAKLKTATPAQRANLAKATPAAMARLAAATPGQRAALAKATPAQIARLAAATPAQRAALARATPEQMERLRNATPAQLEALKRMAISQTAPAAYRQLACTSGVGGPAGLAMLRHIKKQVDLANTRALATSEHNEITNTAAFRRAVLRGLRGRLRSC